MKSKWQKLCDAADWFDPAFRGVITTRLRSEPVFHRKQWEFAAIYAALDDLGVLHETAEGVAFGAGKERLIYSVAERVKKITATDLYQKDAHWEGTKTDDPRNYLLQEAPFTIDESKLDAKYMNMRDITYPDNSFDFAYSSCVLEHISDNDEGFIEHLEEVRRTLKPGGYYVFTTELLYHGQTVPLPGNYFFDMGHLLSLVQRSGLQMAAEFDGRLMPCNLNEPSPFASDFGFNFGHKWMPHITCARQGFLFTSCCLVLQRLDDNALTNLPHVLGFNESQAYVSRKHLINLKKVWEDWQSVAIVKGKTQVPSLIGHEHFDVTKKRAKNHLVFYTPSFAFGSNSMLAQVSLKGKTDEKITVKLISFKRFNENELRIEKELVVESANFFHETLHFDAEEDRIYAVLGRGRGAYELIDVAFKMN